MGWTSYHADFYKKGKPDRKKEMDNVFTQTEHDGYAELTVLKSQMVGSTYYGAIRRRKANEDEVVFAVVCLTSIDMKDYFNFAYKDMDETCGPYECKCPLSILKLLTPTENEWANNWRKKCYEYHEKKKTNMNPSTLPIGTKIRFTLWNGETREIVKQAPNFQFKRAWWYVPGTHTYFPAKHIPEQFEIVA